MRWRHAATSVAVMMGLIGPATLHQRTQAVERTRVTVLFGEADIPDPTTVTLTELPVTVTLPPAAPIVDYDAALRFTRALPPETLIRLVFADTPDAERMVRIARRESNFHCDADNPTSSATGLFQTLAGWRGLTEQRGLSWANVVGPDCLDDVLLARAIYDRSGLGPWRL